jgi:hypothetical protein
MTETPMDWRIGERSISRGRPPIDTIAMDHVGWISRYPRVLLFSGLAVVAILVPSDPASLRRPRQHPRTVGTITAEVRIEQHR